MAPAPILSAQRGGGDGASSVAGERAQVIRCLKTRRSRFSFVPSPLALSSAEFLLIYTSRRLE